MNDRLRSMQQVPNYWQDKELVSFLLKIIKENPNKGNAGNSCSCGETDFIYKNGYMDGESGLAEKILKQFFNRE